MVTTGQLSKPLSPEGQHASLWFEKSARHWPPKSDLSTRPFVNISKSPSPRVDLPGFYDDGTGAQGELNPRSVIYDHKLSDSP